MVETAAEDRAKLTLNSKLFSLIGPVLGTTLNCIRFLRGSEQASEVPLKESTYA